MKALLVESLKADFGGCAVRDVAEPRVGDGQVLVRHRAAAIGFPDMLMTQGLYQHKPPLPFVPGGEVAGDVVAVGAGVSDFAPDNAVVASGLGGLAEYGVYAADALRKKPARLSYAQAASVQSAYLTAYVALVRRAHLQRGEWLLVHGAAGGVGLAAVDLGKYLGARVIAASASDEKLEFIKTHYAPDFCLNISGGFREAVKDMTDDGTKSGADVIYDPVGGDVFDESVRCIAWGGRLLVVGFTSGRIPQIGVNMPLIKGFSVVGVRAGEYGRRDKKRGEENLETIWGLAEAGDISPCVHSVMALNQWRDAFRLMETRTLVGRVVIDPSL